jgi:2-dehydro-3-deoxyphosphooctonate aldolase (KDO 8-P synthase)
MIAEQLSELSDYLDIKFIFKGSFDKANRTSLASHRGPGLEAGLRTLAAIKQRFGVPITTDVHEPGQAAAVAEVVDLLQIPAFLCRQTALLEACGKTGLPVNIKKGQFLAPWDMEGVLSKTTGAKEVWITERGTSFGYNRLVVDYTGMQYMRKHYPVPIVFDATHAVQQPGGNGESSGGNRDYVTGLACAAAAIGINNFFLEVHADPDNAPSDGPNMLKLKDFQTTVKRIALISKTLENAWWI